MSVAAAHKFFDSKLPLLALKSAEQGKPFTCRGAGCFWCCKEAVLCSKDEALYLVEMLSDEEKRAVAARTSEAIARLKMAGLLSLSKPDVYKWRVQQVWCPLLVDGKCSVYERRPFSCRAHHAVGPVENCQDDAKRRGQIFAECPDLLRAAGSRLLDDAVKDVKRGNRGFILMDNLLCWLAEILCGISVETPDRTQIEVTR